MTSQGEHLQHISYASDTLHQHSSTIPPVRRQDSAGKSRIGSSTLTSSKIATEKELGVGNLKEEVKKSVPWECAIIIHTFISY